MTSTSDTAATDPNLDDLLNAHFAGRVVRKDLTKTGQGRRERSRLRS